MSKETPKEEKKTVEVKPKLKQVIYQAPNPMKLIVSPTPTAFVQQSGGTVTRKQVGSPVAAIFEGGVFVLNEKVAQDNKMTFEEMKDAIENSLAFLNGTIKVIGEEKYNQVLSKPVNKPHMRRGPRSRKG